MPYKHKEDKDRNRVEYKQKNKKHLDIIAKEYRVKNAEKAKENTKKWREKNPDRKKEGIAKWRRENPLGWKKSHLKRKFGITLDFYNDLKSIQKGVCAICNKVCVSGRDLAVDHCHETKKVRGLLCGNCNIGIGCFSDSEILLKKAAKYIIKTK